MGRAGGGKLSGARATSYKKMETAMSGINPTLESRMSVLTFAKRVVSLLSVRSPQSAVRSPQSAVRSPQSAVRSPQSAVRSPQPAVRSPQSAVRSPQSAVRSPQSGSPQSAVRSPQSAVRSPQSAVRSPQSQSAVRSPQSAVRSPQSAVRSPQSAVRSPGCLSPRLTPEFIASDSYPSTTTLKKLHFIIPSRPCRKDRSLTHCDRRREAQPAGGATDTVLRLSLRVRASRVLRSAALLALSLGGLAIVAPPALGQDTTAPTISSVTISSTPSFDADGDNTADTYIRGDRIVVDVLFSEAVTVSGGNNGVRLRLDLGADDTNLANSRRVLKLKSVVGGNTLRFEHRVQRRDSDPDGVWVQTLTATNARTVLTVGGAVTSTATGGAAVLTTSGLPTSGAANHKVDGNRTEAVANRPPSFPEIPAGTPVTLYIVDENNAAGAAVVTVAATDPDGDALTYALDSASDAVFDIDSSGNITVTAANALDHEDAGQVTRSRCPCMTARTPLVPWTRRWMQRVV